MSNRIPSSDDRPQTLRAAVLEFMAAAGPRPTAADGRGAEELEFIEALRRIVAETGARSLSDVFPGAHRDRRARIFARYAD
jgi:hypothetical protein